MPGVQLVGAMETTELTPGTSVGGRFIIEATLGTGAMGTVYRAHHVSLDAQVALKVLHPHLVSNEWVVARFLEEARAIASLTSENVARVLDTGCTSDGLVYLALEYVVGQDLEIELRECERLPEKTAVRYALDVCSALAEAHGRGVVHRDLKPENLLIERRFDGTDRIKLTDFGVAKRLYTKRERALTFDSSPVGTPCYMAPEQIADSASVDGRADIFSLGVVLYEMLSGFLPFGGRSTTETYVATLQEEPVSLLDLAPDVTPDLVKVIDRCLKKHREDRYPDVGELARDLARFGTIADRFTAHATERSVGATEVEIDPPTHRTRSASPYPTPQPVNTTLISADIPGRNGGSRWWGAAMAAVVAAGALAVYPGTPDLAHDGLALAKSLHTPSALAVSRDQPFPRPRARPVTVYTDARHARAVPVSPPLPVIATSVVRVSGEGGDSEPVFTKFVPVSDETLAANGKAAEAPGAHSSTAEVVQPSEAASPEAVQLSEVEPAPVAPNGLADSEDMPVADTSPEQ